MMFNIRNYRSDSNIIKGIVPHGKQSNKLLSEASSNGEPIQKLNYHYTQKRELNDGKKVEKKQAGPNNQQVIIINQLSQTGIQVEVNKNLSQQLSETRALDLKLPDLRLYQQKPPKPQSTSSKAQSSKKELNPTINDQQKLPISIRQTSLPKSQLNGQDGISDNRVNRTYSKNEQNQIQKRPNLSLNNIRSPKDFTINYANLSKAGFDGYQQKTNQDKELIILKSPNSGAFGVMDGHGQEGEKVSQFITDKLKGMIYQIYNLKETLNISLESFDFKKVFPDIHNILKQQTGIASQFSGTTATLTIIHDNIVQCGWVGDSRAILGQKKMSRKISPLELSIDHKPDQQDERLRIEQSGGFVDSYHSATGAQLGPYRVWVKGAAYPGLAMSRSLGDLVAASVGVSQIPDVTQFELKDYDLFMIVASDGIWEFISNQQAVEIVYPYYLKNDPKGACQQLYAQAYGVWKQYDDGIDDITSIVVFFNRV